MKCLVVFLLFLLVSSALGDSGMKWPTVKNEFTGPTSGFSPGPVTYTLVVYPQIDSGCIGVSVVTKDNLIYDGPKRTYRAFYDRTPLTFEFSFTVLPNDTSVFYLEIIEYIHPDREGDFAVGYGGAGAIFASTETTVNLLDNDPRPVRDYEMEALKHERDSARAVRESINAARRIGPPHPWDGWSGPLVTGRDSLGNETWDSIASELLKQGIESKRQVTPPPPPLSRDSVERLIKARQQESLERARQVQVARQKEQRPERSGTPQEQMERFIQQNPIAKAVEFVADGPTLWVRREGDSVFTISQPIKDRTDP